MVAYAYEALDAQGNKHRGILEGDSPKQVRAALRDQALIALDVVEASSAGEHAGQKRTPFSKRLKTAEITFVTRQLSIMADAGIPIEKALNMIAQYTTRNQIKTVLLSVRSSILEGNSFAQSLRKQGHIFSETYCALIESGEATGKLPLILELLAKYQEKQQRIKSKIQGATTYPVVLMTLSIGAVIFLLTYVFPDVVGAFQQTGQELPFLTQTLLKVSDFFADYGLIMLAGIAGAIIFARKALQQKEVRLRFERWMLGLPYIGNLIRLSNTVRVSSTMDILVSSGIPLVDTFEISRKTIASVLVGESMNMIISDLKEGVSLGDAVQESEGFDPIFVQLLATGEESGALGKVLDISTRNYEERLERQINTGMELLKPAIIIITGMMILVIVMAILEPILSLNQLAV
jgi:general secretion pathway protein F